MGAEPVVPSAPSAAPRVLIVAEHASAQFGGEAALPLHWFRVLRRRGVPAWLIVHARTRDELPALFPDDASRITFIPDTAWHKLLWRLGRLLPHRLAHFTTGFLLRATTQRLQRPIIRRLVAEHGIEIVHQPIPVSPKEPSLLHGLGAPVVIGPMNGGMEYPPAFRTAWGAAGRVALAAGRACANLLNRLMPGKRRAAVLYVANQRSRDALPRSILGRGRSPIVLETSENGVDLALWQPGAPRARPAGGAPVTRFAFVGRLIPLKAVDLLLRALQRAAAQAPMSLTVIGDGPERGRLEALARELRLDVDFAGWMSQAACAERLRACDALVMPSLMECGGAVVLEAMALGLPVIATDWGGPADYVDATCGVLVPPVSREGFVEGLAAALVRLARSPELRAALGRAGREKVAREYDWEVKADHMLVVYRVLIDNGVGRMSARIS